MLHGAAAIKETVWLRQTAIMPLGARAGNDILQLPGCRGKGQAPIDATGACFAGCNQNLILMPAYSERPMPGTAMPHGMLVMPMVVPWPV